MLVPCNNCGDAVPMADHCLSHPQTAVIKTLSPSGDPVQRIFQFTEHIFRDHHVIGWVFIFGGKKAALYCDGYER